MSLISDKNPNKQSNQKNIPKKYNAVQCCRLLKHPFCADKKSQIKIIGTITSHSDKKATTSCIQSVACLNKVLEKMLTQSGLLHILLLQMVLSAHSNLSSSLTKSVFSGPVLSESKLWCGLFTFL